VSRPLRFCMVTTFYPPFNFGGDGIFVQRLSNELASRGHQVDVVHCVDTYRLLSLDLARHSYQDHPNVTVHGLRSPFGPLSPLVNHQLGSALLKRRQLRALLDRDYDVIHFHNTSLIGGPEVLGYGRAVKLYTIHEYWLVCSTHILFKNNREPCTRRSCLLCPLTYRRPPQLWRARGVVKRALGGVDAFISPDRFSPEMHRKMGLDLPFVYLPHFVPPAAEAARPAPEFEAELRSRPYFLFVGRLEKLKGLQQILPIFRRYPRAELRIAGRGGYERRLRRLAADAPNIHFMGFRSGAELQALYREAVAVVVPSLNYEVAPPLVAMEGFAQGTPALVQDLGSMPEVINDSGGGFIFGDEPSLIEAMDQLLADRALRDQLGASGLEACQTRWSPEEHMRGYFEIIERLRGRTRTEPA